MGGHTDKLVLHNISLAQLVGAFLDDYFERVSVGLKSFLLCAHLAAELTCLNGAAESRHKIVAVNRFLDKVVGTAAQSLDSQVMIAVTSNEQGWYFWTELLN